jgi:hypothetical protein
MSAVERLVVRTQLTRDAAKRSIRSEDLNLTSGGLEWRCGKISGFQAFVNKVVWDNGYTQVVRGLRRGNALLGIYILRPDNSLSSCNIVSGTSDHSSVLLEVEWDEIFRQPKMKRIVPLYHKTDVLGLQTFFRELFILWAGNGSCIEDI